MFAFRLSWYAFSMYLTSWWNSSSFSSLELQNFVGKKFLCKRKLHIIIHSNFMKLWSIVLAIILYVGHKVFKRRSSSHFSTRFIVIATNCLSLNILWSAPQRSFKFLIIYFQNFCYQAPEAVSIFWINPRLICMGGDNMLLDWIIDMFITFCEQGYRVFVLVQLAAFQCLPLTRQSHSQMKHHIFV